MCSGDWNIPTMPLKQFAESRKYIIHAGSPESAHSSTKIQTTRLWKWFLHASESERILQQIRESILSCKCATKMLPPLYWENGTWKHLLRFIQLDNSKISANFPTTKKKDKRHEISLIDANVQANTSTGKKYTFLRSLRLDGQDLTTFFLKVSGELKNTSQGFTHICDGNPSAMSLRSGGCCHTEHQFMRLCKQASCKSM